MTTTSNSAAFMPHLHHHYAPQPTYAQYQEQQQQQRPVHQYYNHHQQHQQSSMHHHSPSWHAEAATPRGVNASYASTSAPSIPTQQYHSPASSTIAMKATGTGKKRKRLQRACVACHKAKRRCDGGLPCSNCDFSGRTCAYSDAHGKAVPPTKRTLRPSEAAAMQDQQQQPQQSHQSGATPSYASSTSQAASPSTAFANYSFTSSSTDNTPERWAEQLDLACSAIHTFADATSTMMKQQTSSSTESALPLTVAHNLAVILERMNEQHALLTEHMTAMGVAMLKKSCSSANQSATSHQDRHAWSDLERRSERLRGMVQMDDERLRETQNWISKDTKRTSNKDNNNNNVQRSQSERVSWSASPPFHPIRQSLSPIQPSSSLFSGNKNGNSYGESNELPKIKSRHNSTSSTATSGSSIMTIGNGTSGAQTYAQLQDPSSNSSVPFLPPLHGLSNLKKDSQAPTLPPLRRFPSPGESNKRSILVEY